MGRLFRGRHLALLALIPSISAFAGVCSTDPIAADSRHEFQFWGGYSPQSSTLIGTATNRRFTALGFNYSYRCWAWNHASIGYTGGIIPAAILYQPEMYGLGTSGQFIVPAHSVYSFGITPLGFVFDFARSRKLYPFIQIDGGIIASTQSIPEIAPGTTALNFLFDFGGGIKVRLRERYAFTFGYKFLHVSDADTTLINPGLDNNVFYAGFSRLK